jgi:hypothetical protein
MVGWVAWDELWDGKIQRSNAAHVENQMAGGGRTEDVRKRETVMELS